MSLILIAYGSKHGHTAKVAGHLASQLRGHGHQVIVADAQDPAASGVARRAAALVVAAPVYFARHPRWVRTFVRRHLTQLHAKPSAFVSVCGALAGTYPAAAADARRYVEAFLELTGWRPRLVVSLAGAMPYRKYGVVTRWMMRRISAWTGRPTDTSRNYEFTNWADVDRFALEFAALLAGEPAAAAAGAGSRASPSPTPAA